MKPLTTAVFLVAAFWSNLGLSAQTKPQHNGKPNTLSVCELLEHAKQYEGRVVTVRGRVIADMHSTAIAEDACGRAVVIRYDVKAQPEAFVEGVEAKRGLMDKRPFVVTVMGRFKARVRGSFGYFSRVEVSRALEYKFVQD